MERQQDGVAAVQKIFKPLAAVVEDDLPPAFMKNALIWAEGIECSCC